MEEGDPGSNKLEETQKTAMDRVEKLQTVQSFLDFVTN